jgi:hypothetical protein
MTIENILDLRRGARYITSATLRGSFGASEVVVIDLANAGLRIAHSHPLRIGTSARLWFQGINASISMQARVIWSHLSKTTDDKGKLLYSSGLKIEHPDSAYPDALQALASQGMIRLESDSLDRKRQRIEERQRQLQAQAKMKIITTTGRS